MTEMKLVEVRKEEVIEALRTENLNPGSWITQWDGGEKCAVCAVGAFLRKKGWERKIIEAHAPYLTFGKALGSLITMKEELEKKNYLGALSIFFENNYKWDQNRQEIIDFVEANFPDRFYMKQIAEALPSTIPWNKGYEFCMTEEGEELVFVRQEL